MFRSSLGDRIYKSKLSDTIITGRGNRQMSFKTGKIAKDARQREIQLRKHREERKKVIRPTTSLRLKKYIQK